MLSNAVMIFSFGSLLQKLVENKTAGVGGAVAAAVISLIVRGVCSFLQEKFSYLASESVKKRLREMIFSKLLRLGSGYREKVSTSEVVQVSVEGVDQLETYFGQYLPQFFYAMLAPVTLFVMLSFVSFKSALVLLICVPLIPAAIVAVQKIAKKLLNKYWGQYTKLGENASNISEGQKQRLALARALLHDSAVYIFDEATSNIDAESENDIMKQIFYLAKTKTVIVISHRLANTAGADMIYAMEKGLVKESGTHEELVQKNGLHAKLWNAQQSLEAVRNGGICP